MFDYILAWHTAAQCWLLAGCACSTTTYCLPHWLRTGHVCSTIHCLPHRCPAFAYLTHHLPHTDGGTSGAGPSPGQAMHTSSATYITQAHALCTLPKKKAPAPPPPGCNQGHQRNPSDPCLTLPRATHQRSPSDPPPLPNKALPAARHAPPGERTRRYSMGTSCLPPASHTPPSDTWYPAGCAYLRLQAARLSLPTQGRLYTAGCPV